MRLPPFRTLRPALLLLPTVLFALAGPLPAFAQPASDRLALSGDPGPVAASPGARTAQAQAGAPGAAPARPHGAARPLTADPRTSGTALANSGTPTLGLLTGEVNGSFIRIGSDIASVVNSSSLRVVPLLGTGSVQNFNDLISFRGVDLALVAADAAQFMENSNRHPSLRTLLNYIAKLYDSEIHLLASPDVHSLADLAGKTINVDVVGSGTSVTAPTLLASTHLNATMTNDTPDVGLHKLMRGEVAAIMYVVGKPNRLFETIPANSGLHFIPVPVSEGMLQTYEPAVLRHADYPNLVPEGETVETMGVPVLLICFNWPANSPRYRNLAAFTDALFSHLSELQEPPHHPKWRDVSLAAKYPGWTRAPFAQQWLDRASAKTTPPPAPRAASAEDQAFTQWVNSNGLAQLNGTQRAQLFSLWQLRRDQPQH